MYIHLGKPVARRAASRTSFDPDISYVPIWPSLKSFDCAATAAAARRLFHFRPNRRTIGLTRALKPFILFHLKLNDEGRARGEISSAPLPPFIPLGE